MQLRRSLATSAALAVLTVGLSSCGFDYATDRYYTPGVGTNDRSGVVDVLSAVVVSTNADSGRLVASLSNGSTSKAYSLTEVTPTEGDSISAAEFEPVEIKPGGLVNLADGPEIRITGTFEAGDFVYLTLGFDSGEQVAMEIPVVSNSGYYEGLDGEPSPSETESAETETESH